MNLMLINLIVGKIGNLNIGVIMTKIIAIRKLPLKIPGLAIGLIGKKTIKTMKVLGTMITKNLTAKLLDLRLLYLLSTNNLGLSRLLVAIAVNLILSHLLNLIQPQVL